MPPEVSPAKNMSAAGAGGFIPSIEGLRALAVLVVLLFHLDIAGFSAGYLGVDLFFVISGFIISRNIVSELGRGTFTLKDFYIRRFRRLFPALLITVLSTLVISLALLPPLELVKTAQSAFFAVFSLANVYFWLQSGYFDAAASTKPLLHTWSLSVEEQFYLFWPAILLLAGKVRVQILLAAVLLAVSLCAALYYRDVFPNAIFYQLPFRLHQLMAGALLGMLSLRLAGAASSLCTVFASLGFLGSTVLFSEHYPPAVGALFVTAFGFLLLLGRDSAVAQVLYANRVMLWIGQRSYAIYLVHWPLIVLFKYATDFELSMLERGLLLVLSFAAAIALHECIEKPLRKRGEDTTRMQKNALPAMAALVVLTVACAGTLWRLDGLPSRMDPRIQQLVESIKTEKKLRRQAIRFGKCNLHREFEFSRYDVEQCAKPDLQRKNVLVIGDSMAADTYMMLNQAYPEIHFLQATAGACTALLETEQIGGKYEACKSLNKLRFSKLLDQQLDLVILASIWTKDRIVPLQKTVEYLTARGQEVLIIGPRAVLSAALPLLVAQQNKFESMNTTLRGQMNRKQELLLEMRSTIPGVPIVDIGSIQCTPHCDVIEGERLWYFDAQHFTQLGALRVGERFRKHVDLVSMMKEAEER